MLYFPRRVRYTQIMDIPEAARQAKKAQIEEQYPAMAKFPDVQKQFIDAQLEDEWGREPVFDGGVAADLLEGTVHLAFMRARGGNAINVPMTMPEAHALYTKLGAALGL